MYRFDSVLSLSSPKAGLSVRGDFLDTPLRSEILAVERGIGNHPEVGDGLKRCIDRVINGNPRGPHELEVFLERRGEPARMLRRVFERGFNNNPDAHLILGVLYARGVAVTKDYTQAERHFEAAERFAVPMAAEYRERTEELRRKAAAA